MTIFFNIFISVCYCYLTDFKYCYGHIFQHIHFTVLFTIGGSKFSNSHNFQQMYISMLFYYKVWDGFAVCLLLYKNWTRYFYLKLKLTKINDNNFYYFNNSFWTICAPHEKDSTNYSFPLTKVFCKETLINYLFHIILKTIFSINCEFFWMILKLLWICIAIRSPRVNYYSAI